MHDGGNSPFFVTKHAVEPVIEIHMRVNQSRYTARRDIQYHETGLNVERPSGAEPDPLRLFVVQVIFPKMVTVGYAGHGMQRHYSSLV